MAFASCVGACFFSYYARLYLARLMSYTPPQPDNAAWPAYALQALGKCPVCQGTERKTVYANLRDELFACAGGQWHMHACGNCHTHYLDPQPHPAHIAKAYSRYFTHADASATKPEAPGARPWWRRALAHHTKASLNSYRNAQWGIKLQPSNLWGKHWVPLLTPVQSLIDQQMRHLPRRPPRPGARLLDIGCGNGAFLELAQQSGWVVRGIDLDPKAVDAAKSRGLDVQQGGLEALTPSLQDRFDWISCSHVLEHVHEPLQWLQAMHALLRPGGTLWLQTPNIASIGHSRYKAHWLGLDPPRHLSLWTLPTLSNAVRKAGFRTVRAHRLPVVSAMAVYAASEALQQGHDNAIALPHSQVPRLRYVWPALRQNWSVQRSEFHTLIAIR